MKTKICRKIPFKNFFGANRAYFPLEIPTCRKYSFEKLPQFSHGNHVLDAHASNPSGSLSTYSKE
jgi:hypothetical protein